ncbi:ABC transporter ATP-binding protein [Roseomonas sp. AR75]|uniref:ABC transporter ATP-binding protein n=1 Tax=Roseomonas sp. AR75 TaxID=2562311 RepID=UPI0010BF9ABC|nr:ATP-binding cassette domain-containing protein [Roseomonas sp. AR75]
MSDLVLDGVTVDGPQGRIVHPTSLTLRPGVPLALLGETGSGKSLLMQAVMGTLPPRLSAGGSVRLDGTDLLRLDAAARRALWGRRIAMLPQEPWAALDPLMRAEAQVAEVPRFLNRAPWAEARRRAGEALAALGLARGERRYPFQLSGGMCQRVALAATRVAGAGVLLADEPTKGLDTALRDGVTALLRAEAEAGRILLAITHDVAVARGLGGEVGVMLEGEVVESGPAAAVLAAPRHAYTRRLLAAEPAAWAPWPRAETGGVLVEGRGLAKRFGAQRLFEGVDVALRAGGRVALFGPSGSGKSTLGNLLLGLLRPDAGEVRRAPGLVAPFVQKLYQDPVAAFAPRRTVGQAIEAVVARHRLDARATTRWMEALRLSPGLLARRPDEVSGGELQRFALLRAMLPGPRVLFADEPTSRLDPVTQQEVMDRLRDALAASGAALLLVTHDRDIAGKAAKDVLALGG